MGLVWHVRMVAASWKRAGGATRRVVGRRKGSGRAREGGCTPGIVSNRRVHRPRRRELRQRGRRAGGRVEAGRGVMVGARTRKGGRREYRVAEAEAEAEAVAAATAVATASQPAILPQT
ncbi:hypothetical protein DBV15_05519 [Temnothorax longispinosus]|uniref:Uncharacterized protein n=1 Tax=Temnothorax longispinosus TaxID=300112 RepID=A0A4S2KBW8_9HYME|nr:hypothetical protein DBV15_05519 [Temnothorax longispinosus]